MKNKNIIIITTILTLIIPLAIATTISGQGSSYVFNITNCNAQPNTTTNCNSTTIRFECNIYNPSFINAVEFRINGNDYNANQNGTNPQQFYYFYNKPQDYTSTNDPIQLDRERITDTNNIKVNAYELVSIPRNCSTCSATYTNTTTQACNTTNQKITQYLSNNETCAPSYNTTETCNYCSPNIISNTTTCTFNNTRTKSYTDLNYTTCCLTTGLSEDCIINTPLYQNTTETCNYLTKEFNCNLDQSPILNPKINVNCELPSENHSCIINVYQETSNSTSINSSTLLATSPEYKKSSGSLLSLAQESEERTAFQTDQRLLNAYYTTKELRPTNTYKIQVVCNTPQSNSIKYEELITPVYHTPDSILYRSIWGTQNNLLIIFWTALIILLTALGYWAIRTYTANRR